MKFRLISKFNGSYIETLDAVQATSLCKGYLEDSPVDQKFFELLSYIRQKESFVECNCLQHAENSPQLGTRQISNKLLTLVNLPGRKEHLQDCPLAYHKYVAQLGCVDRKDSVNKIAYMGEGGRILADFNQLESLYSSIINISKLNHLSNKPISNGLVQKAIISAAKGNRSLRCHNISPVMNISECNEQLKQIRDRSKASGRLEYSIVFGLITHFDDRIIMRQFGENKPFKVSAGQVNYKGVTNIGPFVSTTLLVGRDGKAFPLATHVQPVLKNELPVPVSSDASRELLDELLFNKGSLVEWLNSKLTDQTVSVVIPLEPLITPLHKESFLPSLVLKCGSVNVFIGNPIGDEQTKYRESGCLVWHQGLSVIPEYKQITLKKLKSRLAGAILNT